MSSNRSKDKKIISLWPIYSKEDMIKNKLINTQKENRFIQFCFNFSIFINPITHYDACNVLVKQKD